MRKWVIGLGGLLILQMVLAVGLNFRQEEYGALEPTEKVMAFDVSAVDNVRIDAESDQHLVLKKQEGEWQLPALNGFPADQGSVTGLLDKLAGLQKGWPVATTAGAARRFKVSDEAFERKITLGRGEERLATLFVGTSPGFRKVHVRTPEGDAIYAAEFSAFESGVKPEDWIDKTVLKHQANDIQEAKLPGFTLKRQGDRLVVADLKEGEAVVENEAKRLLDQLAGLTIRSVLGTEAKPEYGQDKPALRYTLVLKSGEKATYVFSKPKDADYYVLKAPPRDEYFQLDTWTVDPIKEVTRDKLIRKQAEDKTTVEEHAEGAGVESAKESPVAPETLPGEGTDTAEEPGTP